MTASDKDRFPQSGLLVFFVSSCSVVNPGFSALSCHFSHRAITTRLKLDTILLKGVVMQVYKNVSPIKNSLHKIKDS